MDIRLTRRRNALAIVWFVVVGVFVGASGAYFFGHGFHLSVAVLLGIAGVVIGIAISAVLKCGKLDRARRARTRNNAGQIRASWDYRPRHGMQHHAGSQGAETVSTLSLTVSAERIDDTVWFDFVPIESATTDEPTNPPIPKP